MFLFVSIDRYVLALLVFGVGCFRAHEIAGDPDASSVDGSAPLPDASPSFDVTRSDTAPECPACEGACDLPASPCAEVACFASGCAYRYVGCGAGEWCDGQHGCQEGANTWTIVLRTDFLPAEDFDRIVVGALDSPTLDPQPHFEVEAAGDFEEGVELGTFQVSPSTLSLVIGLYQGCELVAERQPYVGWDEPGVLTVSIARTRRP